MEQLLTMDEAAGLLKLSKSQLYELTRSRSRLKQRVQLPIIRIGKRKMFRASSLHDWVCQLEKLERSGQ